MIDFPHVTLIMPVRNEAGFINRSLGAVLAQDYPQDRLEVIVADGMSTDGTREAVASLQTSNSNLTLIDNPKKIAPTALNLAIARAKGQFIVRVDGHCEIARDYISRCISHLLREDIDGVGGPLETIGESLTASVIATAMSSKFGVGDSAFRTVSDKTMLTDTVAFPAYTRSIIERAGPFDEEMVRNQDDEYNYRLRKIGAKILLAADIRVRYYSRSSFSSLWRQYFQYGYWKVRVLQKHPGQMRARQFVPFTFVCALSLSLLILPVFPSAKFIFAVIVATYVLANLVASLLESRGKEIRFLFLLPVTYVIIHVAYGLGSVIGLIKFWNRWGDTGLNHKQLKAQVGSVD